MPNSTLVRVVVSARLPLLVICVLQSACGGGGGKSGGDGGADTDTGSDTETDTGTDPGGEDTIWKVRADADPGGDGLTWETAFADLQQALASALPGEEIWVAAGTYTPTAGDDRAVSFALEQGVGLYGGFGGTEEERDQRDWVANRTVLSGDIGVPGDDSDNSYHVVIGADDAVLDGFTITGGRAEGWYPYSSGGGMLNDEVNITVSNCVFRDNSASHWGGGMANSNSQATVTDCSFIDNSAEEGGGIGNFNGHTLVAKSLFTGNTAWRGGGMMNILGSALVTGSVFAGNSASSGGGMMSDGYFHWHSGSGKTTGGCGYGGLLVENCVFAGNSASYGGALANYYSWVSVTNSTISGNSAENDGGGIDTNDEITIVNTVIRGNTAKGQGDSIFGDYYDLQFVRSCIDAEGWDWAHEWEDEIIYLDPLFVDAADPVGPDGIWMTADDGLRLAGGSPCIDAANGDLAPEFDIIGNPRFDCPDVENTGIGSPPFADIGAYEYHP